MPSREFIKILPKDAKQIRFDQYKYMYAIWMSLAYDEKNPTINRKRFQLSRPLMHETIEHFINDVDILKIRYKIAEKDFIQPHKVAGLLTASILRHKPIIPLIPKYDERESIFNEVFATLNGLAVCGEYLGESSPRIIGIIKKKPWFKSWFSDFIHLLQKRNFTSESLIGIYETLSLIAFPGYREEYFINKK